VSFWEVIHERFKPDPLAPIVVKPGLLVPFYRRLSAMLTSGINISRALDFLAGSEDDAKLSRALDYMVGQIHAGRSLSKTMKSGRLELVFPPTIVSLIAVGEQTGGLVAVMEKLADLTEKQQRLRREFVSAMAYPCVLAIVMSLVAITFVLILGPRDQGLFSMFGGNLPWPTEMLVSFSNFLRRPDLIFGALLCIMAAVYYVRKRLREDADFAVAVDARLLTIPIVGPLLMKTAAARMLYVLATAVSVGISVSKALQLALTVCGNLEIKSRLERAISEFQEGVELSDCLDRHKVFPRLVTCVIHTGLESGKLDPLLAKLSDNFEEEVSATLADAARLAEPILLAFSGLVATFLALATLLPVIQLATKF
jgi:type IV pilus assembly protein PilC